MKRHSLVREWYLQASKTGLEAVSTGILVSLILIAFTQGKNGNFDFDVLTLGLGTLGIGSLMITSLFTASREGNYERGKSKAIVVTLVLVALMLISFGLGIVVGYN